MWYSSVGIYALAFLMTAVLPLGAQPHRPDIDERLFRESWTIRMRTVEASIRHQVATVSVTDEIYNPQPYEIETEYLFPLPQRALVDQFTLVMNGQELCGTILDAAEARNIYEQIVRARRDPGLLEYAGCGLFRSSAFPLGPQQKAAITIRYTMICPMDGNRVEFWHPLRTGRGMTAPIEDFTLRCNIESDAAITTVYSPTNELDLDRRSPTHVIADFENRNYVPAGEFQLFYETSTKDVGVSLFTYWPDPSEDGYYLLMVNPKPAASESVALAKRLVIVLDRSGSMSGEKVAQGRAAVTYLLDHLNPLDRFNLITYSDAVESCFHTVVPATSAKIAEARDYTERITAAGGTNIHDALAEALEQTHGSDENELPTYIIFLTDGLPTVGIVDEAEILADTRRANRHGVKIFAFGVGYDVNVRLLDKLVAENHGRSVFVRPNESLEAKITSLYNRVRSPVMTDLSIDIDGFSTRENCPAELGDLFQNDQIIRAGRIHRRLYNLPPLFGGSEACTLTLSGTVNGVRKVLTYDLPLPSDRDAASNRFVEKVWAVRRVGVLLDQIQVQGRTEEFLDELIALSKKYGIVTPYTSFLADEHRDLANTKQLREEALPRLQASKERVSGPAAHMDASARMTLQSTIIPQPLSSSECVIQVGTSDQAAYERDESKTVSTVRAVAGETLYKRGDCWVTADALDIDLTSGSDGVKKIQRYSDEYFQLLEIADDAQDKVIAAQAHHEKLLIKIDGRAYLIE